MLSFYPFFNSNFLKNSVIFFKKPFFLKKNLYFYGDFFLYIFSSKNELVAGFFFLKNFFSFFKFYSINSNKFLILDYNFYYTNMFNSLIYKSVDLLKYNYFFKFNFKLLKYQHFLFMFNSIFKKLNINMLIILDYQCFYLYFQYFNFFNVLLFSFIYDTKFSNQLDFFYVTNKNLQNIEKIFFLSKILQIYNFYTKAKFFNSYSNFI